MRYTNNGTAIIGSGVSHMSIGDIGDKKYTHPGDDINWGAEPKKWIETTIADLMFSTDDSPTAEKRQQIACYALNHYPHVKRSTKCCIGSVTRNQELRVNGSRFRVVGHKIHERKVAA